MTQRPASDKQFALIASLLTQVKALDPELAAYYEPQAQRALTVAGASSLIDELFSAKRTAGRKVNEVKAAPERESIDHGFHQVTIDGVTKILKVKHPKGGGRPYAYGIKFQWDECFWGEDAYNTGRWFYLGRKYNDLLSSATLVDATQAAAFGHAHGWCLVCSTGLEDPESVHDGIGPSCYKTITGETKAQARKAGHLAQLPPAVQAEVKARRAAQKANRDAEKRALAEVA